MGPVVNEKIIEYMNKVFGELTVTRGKKQKFIGTNTTIQEYKKTDIEMVEQAKIYNYKFWRNRDRNNFITIGSEFSNCK